MSLLRVVSEYSWTSNVIDMLTSEVFECSRELTERINDQFLLPFTLFTSCPGIYTFLSTYAEGATP